MDRVILGKVGDHGPLIFTADMADSQSQNGQIQVINCKICDFCDDHFLISNLH